MAASEHLAVDRDLIGLVALWERCNGLNPRFEAPLKSGRLERSEQSPQSIVRRDNAWQ